MSYSIDLNITDVDHDKKTLKVQGLKVTFGYLEEIIVTPILNSLKPSEGVHIMKQLAAAGLRTHIWAAFARAAAETIRLENEERQEAERQAAIQAERMRAMSMTPEEIRRENEKRQAERAETARKIRGHSGNGF